METQANLSILQDVAHLIWGVHEEVELTEAVVFPNGDIATYSGNDLVKWIGGPAELVENQQTFSIEQVEEWL
jgi:hypothetical protein